MCASPLLPLGFQALRLSLSGEPLSEVRGQKRRKRARSERSAPSVVTVDPRQLALELIEQMGGGKRPECPTLGEFYPRFLLHHCKANRHKPSSIEAVESIWRNHLDVYAGRRLDSFCAVDVQGLKAKLRKRKAKTVNNVLSCLSGILRAAVRWDILPKMPVKIELLKTSAPKIEFYDFDEFARLSAAASAVGPEVEVMILLGGDAGLRTGEIIALEWRDIHFGMRLITISRAEWKGRVGPPKGNQIREVPMTKRLEAALSRMPFPHSGRILRRPDGDTVSEQTLRTWTGWAQTRAGLEARGNKHVLRHTFCSHLAMRGASMLAIQELAGHVDLRTTRRYMHLAAREKRTAVDLLER